MAATPQAAAVIGVLNKVIKYAIGLGAGASALQTSLYNGKAPERSTAMLYTISTTASQPGYAQQLLHALWGLLERNSSTRHSLAMHAQQEMHPAFQLPCMASVNLHLQSTDSCPFTA
jgi:hypothetical protein